MCGTCEGISKGQNIRRRIQRCKNTTWSRCVSRFQTELGNHTLALQQRTMGVTKSVCWVYLTDATNSSQKRVQHWPSMERAHRSSQTSPSYSQGVGKAWNAGCRWSLGRTGGSRRPRRRKQTVMTWTTPNPGHINEKDQTPARSLWESNQLPLDTHHFR